MLIIYITNYRQVSIVYYNIIKLAIYNIYLLHLAQRAAEAHNWRAKKCIKDKNDITYICNITQN